MKLKHFISGLVIFFFFQTVAYAACFHDRIGGYSVTNNSTQTIGVVWSAGGCAGILFDIALACNKAILKPGQTASYSYTWITTVWGLSIVSEPDNGSSDQFSSSKSTLFHGAVPLTLKDFKCKQTRNCTFEMGSDGSNPQLNCP